MITYICNNNIRNFWIYLKGYFKANNGKKTKNEITIEYLHWKKLYYKSLALNNIKKGMANWNSCHF
jgi:hypothetical protein